MNFIREAALSEEEKPIVALPSITSKGISKLVSTLARESSVITKRAHFNIGLKLKMEPSIYMRKT